MAIQHSIKKMTKPYAQDEKRGVNELPTIPELIKQFGVGSITVHQAFQVLTDEGLIESFRGKGTFVKDHAHAGFQNDDLREIISNPVGKDPDLKIKVLKRKTVDELPYELKGRRKEQGRNEQHFQPAFP